MRCEGWIIVEERDREDKIGYRVGDIVGWQKRGMCKWEIYVANKVKK